MTLFLRSKFFLTNILKFQACICKHKTRLLAPEFWHWLPESLEVYCLQALLSALADQRLFKVVHVSGGIINKVCGIIVHFAIKHAIKIHV